MSRVLLVEPDYRSKFPPLGLMKISAFHRRIGDEVVFVRGQCPEALSQLWGKVYLSSLFTWELPRTVKTIKYYSDCVANPSDLIVGGVGATLMPDYIQSQVACRVVRGPLNRKGLIDPNVPAIDNTTPDYSMIEQADYDYSPSDSFFTRCTQGCIRRCKFCAVPRIEPRFYYVRGWMKQIRQTRESFGDKQHLVLLDNNVLAAKDHLGQIISQIRSLGFHAGAKLHGRKRKVDFNQGIDARLVSKKTADLLASLCIEPIRLAFDSRQVEQSYVRAIERLSTVGFRRFTNYVMYNYSDSPGDLYYRLKRNFALSMRV